MTTYIEITDEVRAEILRDIGECKDGVSYIFDNGKWREVEEKDYPL